MNRRQMNIKRAESHYTGNLRDLLAQPLRVQVYRPDKSLPLPYNKDPKGNAGWDLYATETIQMGPGDIVKVPVNACLGLPGGFYGRIAPRSGLSSEGINVIPGTIDSNYRGQISAITQNITGQPFTVERGMRIAQLIVMKHELPEWQEVDKQEDLGHTLRGTSGFGGSGVF